MNISSRLYWGFTLIFWLVSFSSWIVAPESIILNSVLLVIGIALIFGKLFWTYRSVRLIAKEFKFTRMISLLISLVLFLAIWSLANFVVYKKQLILYSHSIGEAKLSEQSLALIKQVKKSKFTLYTKRERWNFFLPLLRKVKAQNSLIEFEAFDLDLHPSYIQKHKLTGIDALIIESGNKKITTYFNPDKKVELTLINALLRLTQDRPMEIVFSQGHGEFQITDEGNQGLSYLREKLEEQSFVTMSLDLVKSDIPLSTSLFIIWGPKRMFETSEIDRIKKFLKRGGQLLIAQGPVFGNDSFREMRELLESWDLRLQNQIVLDKLSPAQGMEPTIVIAQSANKTHPVLKSFKSKLYMPLSAPLKITQNLSNKRALPMLTSEAFPAVWGESNLSGVLKGQAVYEEGKDEKGPFVLMASSQQVDGNMAGIVTVASSSFALNNYSAQASHFQLLLNTISWQLGLDHLVLKNRYTDKREPIILSQKHIYLIFYIAVLLLPLLGMFAALYFYTRKKNL